MNELLSLGRMARRIGVSQQWLRNQADSGNIPGLRAGKRYLFNATAVEERLATVAARLQASPDEATLDGLPLTAKDLATGARRRHRDTLDVKAGDADL